MITTTLRFKASGTRLNALENSVVHHVNGIPRLAPAGFPSAPANTEAGPNIAMWGQLDPPAVVVSRDAFAITLKFRTASLPIGVLKDASRWGACVSAEIDGEDIEGALLNGAIAIDLKPIPARMAA